MECSLSSLPLFASRRMRSPLEIKISPAGAFLLVSILLLSGPVHAGDIGLVPGSLALPPPPPAAQEQRVQLSSRSAELIQLDPPFVESVQGPDGVSTSNQAVAVSAEEEGSRFLLTVTPQRENFEAPGTYKIVLRLSGKRRAALKSGEMGGDGTNEGYRTMDFTESVEIPLVRPEVTLKVVPDGKLIQVLDRDWPWLEAEGESRLSVLVEKGSKLDSLTVQAGAVRRAAAVGGAAEIRPNTKGKMTIKSTDPVPVKDNEANVVFAFKSFDLAGKFESSLTLSGPGLISPVVVPIEVYVKDQWIAPFLMILFGVLSGFGVHWVVRKWRPAQLVRYRLAEMRNRLDRLRHAVASPTSINAIDEIRHEIWTLETALGASTVSDNQVNAVKTQIDTLETELDAARGRAVAAVSGLKDQIGDVREALFGLLNGTEFQATGDEIAQVHRLLLSDRPEEAEILIGEATTTFEDLRQDTVLRIVNDLLQKAAQVTDQFERDEIEAKLKAIGMRDISASTIRPIGIEIRRIANVIKSALPAAGLSFTSKLTADAPSGKNPIIEAMPSPQVNLIIRFEILNLPPGRVVDRVIWNLGGGPLVAARGDLHFERVFRTPCQIFARAEVIFQDGTKLQIDPRLFSVLPSTPQTLMQRLSSNIERADLLIMVAAIVVATGIGFLANYDGKPFGTVEDYFVAWLWGFGMEKTVRGFSATFGALAKTEQ